ncbi:hypothetical protein [Streptomyces sp. NPDC018045]|uniref:hypothetical protein n=1 Tax=unclassified Streptomyces TaxID=2593676 RepID=UPI0037A68487
MDELDRKSGHLHGRLYNHLTVREHLPEAPERVHSAWAKVTELHDQASDALDNWQRAGHEGEEAEKRRLAEHHAYLSGEGPKPKGAYKRMDIEARRADALLECEARVKLVESARHEYRQLLKETGVIEETRERLLTKFDGLQAKALEAVTAAETAFNTWIRVSNSLGQVTADLGLGGGPKGHAPSIDKERLGWFYEAHETWAKLYRVLGTNDPVASGRWATMSREELLADPPVWQREILARNHPRSQDRARLRRIELKERAEGRLISALEVPADMSPAEAKDLLPGA